MNKRKKMTDRYRRFSLLTDFGGMQSAIGELRGMGYPPQPRLAKNLPRPASDPVFDEAWFARVIRDKVAGHPDNSMEYPFWGEAIFDEPLVGFVRGDDPIFNELKTVIGPHHFTPQEIMSWQASKSGVAPPRAEDLSVVAFVLPISKKTVADNSVRSDWLAERWAQTRLHGEIFSQTMVREIVTYLMVRGILAISPDVTPLFNKKRYPRVGWASPWSHRHIVYAAGLGTFGMHDFLITPKGCAHRVGSFVVNLNLKPDRERPKDIHAWCRHYQGKSCMVCARRCPAGAITEKDAHDKEACYRRVAQSVRYCNRNYHIFIYGCGLCATKVPCATGIPKDLP